MIKKYKIIRKLYKWEEIKDIIIDIVLRESIKIYCNEFLIDKGSMIMKILLVKIQ